LTLFFLFVSFFLHLLSGLFAAQAQFFFGFLFNLNLVLSSSQKFSKGGSELTPPNFEGDAEGLSDGNAVEATVGDLERDSEGDSVGDSNALGTLLGTLEGTALGNPDGLAEGDELGISLGTSLGVPLGPELGFTDVLGGELGISLGCSLGGKTTVASNPRLERLDAKSPDAIESSLSAAATLVLTPVEGGAVIVMKTCKHCLPDISIPLSSTILEHSSDITSASTLTAPSSSIKARLLAIPA